MVFYSIFYAVNDAISQIYHFFFLSTLIAYKGVLGGQVLSQGGAEEIWLVWEISLYYIFYLITAKIFFVEVKG